MLDLTGSDSLSIVNGGKVIPITAGRIPADGLSLQASAMTLRQALLLLFNRHGKAHKPFRLPPEGTDLLRRLPEEFRPGVDSSIQCHQILRM